MAELVYCGPRPAPGTGIPLPEGWPMADHNEEDPVTLKAKLESGMYRRAPRDEKAEDEINAEDQPPAGPPAAKVRAKGASR